MMKVCIFWGEIQFASHILTYGWLTPKEQCPQTTNYSLQLFCLPSSDVLLPGYTGLFYINLTKVRLIREEGLSIEEMYP